MDVGKGVGTCDGTSVGRSKMMDGVDSVCSATTDKFGAGDDEDEGKTDGCAVLVLEPHAETNNSIPIKNRHKGNQEHLG
jgi:hypothetical protein